MAPSLLDDTEPVIDEYEDYAVIDFPLTRSFNEEEVMDTLEDDMDLFILYHCVDNKEENGGHHHICAISDSCGDYMYKLNIVTNGDNMISRISITLYTSIEQMLEGVQGDLVLHEEEGYSFIDKMDEGTLVSFFSV